MASRENRPTSVPLRQVRSNDIAADSWERYEAHRSRVMDLIVAAGPAPRLALLGVGNGNDVDVPKLLESYDELHLVDVDARALSRAHRRVPVQERRRVHVHVADVTGLLCSLPRWRTGLPRGPGLIAELAAGSARAIQAWPTCDVVVSGCMLTQAALAIADACEGDAIWTKELKRAIAVEHLKVLARKTTIGGRVLLLTDLVSSDTYPVDDSPAATPDVLHHLLASENVFPSADPRVLMRALRRDPELCRLTCSAAVSSPWRWTALPDRSYLVYALSFCTNAHASTGETREIEPVDEERVPCG